MVIGPKNANNRFDSNKPKKFIKGVVTHFWVPAQNTKKKFKIFSKIIAVKRGCQNAQKMVKNWLRRFKNTKIEI